MKFLFRHFLLFGVILGLVGQGVAFAAPPCAAMQKAEASAMAGPMAGMPDCAMGQHKSDKGSAPCKDMSPGCMAMAGCAALAAIDVSPAVMLSPPLLAALAAWPATPILLGRTDPPDPYPPSFLA
ncbi:MAG: hypothetical protein K2P79_08795 [Sphingomonas sp.]|nr:hypothetical protein [Sphingomonas sp.]